MNATQKHLFWKDLMQQEGNEEDLLSKKPFGSIEQIEEEQEYEEEGIHGGGRFADES